MSARVDRDRAIDARAEEMFGASVVFQAFGRLMAAGLAAWPKSWTRRVLFHIPPAAGRSEALNAVVFWAVAALTASVAALALAPFGTTPRPLAWMVPLACGAAAAVIALLAGTRRGSKAPSR